MSKGLVRAAERVAVWHQAAENPFEDQDSPAVPEPSTSTPPTGVSPAAPTATPPPSTPNSNKFSIPAKSLKNLLGTLPPSEEYTPVQGHPKVQDWLSKPTNAAFAKSYFKPEHQDALKYHLGDENYGKLQQHLPYAHFEALVTQAQNPAPNSNKYKIPANSLKKLLEDPHTLTEHVQDWMSKGQGATFSKTYLKPGYADALKATLGEKNYSELQNHLNPPQKAEEEGQLPQEHPVSQAISDDADEVNQIKQQPDYASDSDGHYNQLLENLENDYLKKDYSVSDEDVGHFTTPEFKEWWAGHDKASQANMAQNISPSDVLKWYKADNDLLNEEDDDSGEQPSQDDAADIADIKDQMGQQPGGLTADLLKKHFPEMSQGSIGLYLNHPDPQKNILNNLQKWNHLHPGSLTSKTWQNVYDEAYGPQKQQPQSLGEKVNALIPEIKAEGLDNASPENQQSVLKDFADFHKGTPKGQELQKLLDEHFGSPAEQTEKEFGDAVKSMNLVGDIQKIFPNAHKDIKNKNLPELKDQLDKWLTHLPDIPGYEQHLPHLQALKNKYFGNEQQGLTEADIKSVWPNASSTVLSEWLQGGDPVKQKKSLEQSLKYGLFANPEQKKQVQNLYDKYFGSDVAMPNQTVSNPADVVPQSNSVDGVKPYGVEAVKEALPHLHNSSTIMKDLTTGHEDHIFDLLSKMADPNNNYYKPSQDGAAKLLKTYWPNGKFSYDPTGGSGQTQQPSSQGPTAEEIKQIWPMMLPHFLEKWMGGGDSAKQKAHFETVLTGSFANPEQKKQVQNLYDKYFGQGQQQKPVQQLPEQETAKPGAGMPFFDAYDNADQPQEEPAPQSKPFKSQELNPQDLEHWAANKPQNPGDWKNFTHWWGDTQLSPEQETGLYNSWFNKNASPEQAADWFQNIFSHYSAPSDADLDLQGGAPGWAHNDWAFGGNADKEWPVFQAWAKNHPGIPSGLSMEQKVGIWNGLSDDDKSEIASDFLPDKKVNAKAVLNELKIAYPDSDWSKWSKMSQGQLQKSLQNLGESGYGPAAQIFNDHFGGNLPVAEDEDSVPQEYVKPSPVAQALPVDQLPYWTQSPWGPSAAGAQEYANFARWAQSIGRDGEYSKDPVKYSVKPYDLMSKWSQIPKHLRDEMSLSQKFPWDDEAGFNEWLNHQETPKEALQKAFGKDFSSVNDGHPVGNLGKMIKKLFENTLRKGNGTPEEHQKLLELYHHFFGSGQDTLAEHLKKWDPHPEGIKGFKDWDTYLQTHSPEDAGKLIKKKIKSTDDPEKFLAYVDAWASYFSGPSGHPAVTKAIANDNSESEGLSPYSLRDLYNTLFGKDDSSYIEDKRNNSGYRVNYANGDIHHLYMGWTPPGGDTTSHKIDPAQYGNVTNKTYIAPLQSDSSAKSEQYETLLDNVKNKKGMFSSQDQLVMRSTPFKNWFDRAPKAYQATFQHNPASALDDFEQFMKGNPAYSPPVAGGEWKDQKVPTNTKSYELNHPSTTKGKGIEQKPPGVSWVHGDQYPHWKQNPFPSTSQYVGRPDEYQPTIHTDPNNPRQMDIPLGPNESWGVHGTQPLYRAMKIHFDRHPGGKAEKIMRQIENIVKGTPADKNDTLTLDQSQFEDLAKQWGKPASDVRESVPGTYNHPELAKLILDFLELGHKEGGKDDPGLGIHWTVNEKKGHTPPSSVGLPLNANNHTMPVLIYGDWGGAGEDTNRSGGAVGYPGEEEITLSPGARLRIPRLKVKTPEGDWVDVMNHDNTRPHLPGPHMRTASRGTSEFDLDPGNPEHLYEIAVRSGIPHPERYGLPMKRQGSVEEQIRHLSGEEPWEAYPSEEHTERRPDSPSIRLAAFSFDDDAYRQHTAQLDHYLESLFAHNKDTRHLYGIVGNDGNTRWSPARHQQQKRALARAWHELGADDVPQNGQAALLAGLPGSGKRSLLRSPLLGLQNHLPIDPDFMKEIMAKENMVPRIQGYSPMETSPLAHHEASELATRLARMAYGQGRNVVWDTTMGNPRATADTIRDLRKSGYSTVNGALMDVSPDTARVRADQRHRSDEEAFRNGSGLGGRWVPLGVSQRNILATPESGFKSRPEEVFHQTATPLLDNTAKFNGETTPATPVSLSGPQWGGKPSPAPAQPPMMSMTSATQPQSVRQVIESHERGELPWEHVLPALSTANYSRKPEPRNLTESYQQAEEMPDDNDFFWVNSANDRGVINDAQHKAVLDGINAHHAGRNLEARIERLAERLPDDDGWDDLEEDWEGSPREPNWEGSPREPDWGGSPPEPVGDRPQGWATRAPWTNDPRGRQYFPPNGINPQSDSPARPHTEPYDDPGKHDPHLPLGEDAGYQWPNDRGAIPLYRGFSLNLTKREGEQGSTNPHDDPLGWLRRSLLGPDYEPSGGPVSSQALAKAHPLGYDNPEIGPFILNHLKDHMIKGNSKNTGLGRHWSTDEDAAHSFALEKTNLGTNPTKLPVKIHAQWKGLGEDPYRSNTGGNWPAEHEITMTKGAPMHIDSVQIRHPETQKWHEVLNPTPAAGQPQPPSQSAVHQAAGPPTKGQSDFELTGSIIEAQIQLIEAANNIEASLIEAELEYLT